MPTFLTTDEIRRRWIEFFKSKGHLHVPADSLVPANDPSVLFTGAGMNQFKDHFAGIAKLDHPHQRAVTVQPCVRASDIENVGRTPNHHACFEMLGNFSFGDYFKTEAIEWAVEFLTDAARGLGLDPRRLSVTVFKGDEKLKIEKDQEAIAAWQRFAPWLKDERISGGWRIHEYGEHDNFWPADAPSLGPNGPCGPCSEIYYDTHPAWNDDPSKVPPPVPVTEDEKRYCEIWNLVFTQFDRRDVGVLKPLPQKNIDTGSGLERMARVIQGKPNNYEIDLLFPVVLEVGKLAGKAYGKNADDDRRMRRITDHVRFAVIAIHDGVPPKNEGRNYVVRRLMRRAMLDGRELGIEGLFLPAVASAVIRQMKVGYPSLAKKEDAIQRTITEEEKNFDRTLTHGRQHFVERIASLRKSGARMLSGADAFKLWDTYGFPIELTVESADSEGIKVDLTGYESELEAAKERSRSGSDMAGEIFKSGPLAEIARIFAKQPTEFMGYDQLAVDDAEVLAIVQNGQMVEIAYSGAAIVLLDGTPFYAESGGQVGDRGTLTGSGTRAKVVDTQKLENLIFHHIEIPFGTLEVREFVRVSVNERRRAATLKNHSATHLLHLALRQLLGTHVEQRGSLVAPERLRFDFTHSESVGAELLARIEARVNGWIQDDFPVETVETTPDEAKKAGAMALFGEKYGSKVRMVAMGPSKELCGGTHVARTGQIGYFRLASEGAVAAGVRRIEALTGSGAVAEARAAEQTLGTLAHTLKTRREDLLDRLTALQEEKSALEKQLSALQRQAASAAASSVLDQVKEVDGAKLLAAAVLNADAATLRETLDGIRKKLPEAAVVLGGAKDGKAALLVSVPKELVARGAHAGNLMRELAAKVGGKGGGKPDMAQGGGSEPDKLSEALDAAESILKGMLSPR
ncbi:MAG: alanine--tRNA ligase [Planctomycetota bacterium]